MKKKMVREYLLPLWLSPVITLIMYDLFRVIEESFGYPLLKVQFKLKTGYNLNLKNPQSFNEKVCWKKIYDRNPLLPFIADKYRVREYLMNVLGKKTADKILVPLLHVTDKPETIPFDDLPEEYIIKSNHGSGTNLIVVKGKPVDRKYIIARCREMLHQPHGLFMHEWAYQPIDRKIIVEKLMRDENDEIPTDFKFHIFHGKCQLIDVFFKRFADKKRSIFDRFWNYQDVGWSVSKWKRGGPIQKPKNLEDMIVLAEFLGSPFDYIRVDLYSINGQTFFGELTNYPASGYGAFDPQSFDFELGKKWKLIPNYWKNIIMEDKSLAFPAMQSPWEL
jgi:hypothetical protein